MTINDKTTKGVYITPLTDVSEALEDVMLCQSGTTEDWTYDEEGEF